jgi:hypothetical protein
VSIRGAEERSSTTLLKLYRKGSAYYEYNIPSLGQFEKKGLSH